MRLKELLNEGMSNKDIKIKLNRVISTWVKYSNKLKNKNKNNPDKLVYVIDNVNTFDIFRYEEDKIDGHDMDDYQTKEKLTVWWDTSSKSFELGVDSKIIGKFDESISEDDFDNIVEKWDKAIKNGLKSFERAYL